ncbi:MAG: RnfABCDGE type electron transport complex subunit D [Candidatus Thiodiazotropha sp. (ex Ctena orbiculata)]|uniref:Ion-translocating oxidoreductase complex subunit D n=1 Tax=Candidatus Thiodiazotropha taylori TaxID=2792791 RepID=A0A944QRV1_9GAMM|nr:RnfABCDGE type electron transport complex subunit D [Candidatus Thiodiazotropha taylori]MBT3026494.1 RnfABCDGE type electron transport complex subunit D [Candidatus Thiodiazotropha taylori]MBT3034384.1 RnfABCDGE type electron transport complex subunit D [Candidatus Thiodiazotropha taylori]MBV2136318.1 RnfABCDGE type electron transport complex subunit D [Candidatus Thiodiazotropha taylori]PVV09328.1 MAG: electron transporter RnfD [gamma proteobacterium symbiont of Ctena orbiculata]
MSKKPTIELRTSPHAHAGDDVIRIMRNVVYALVPISLFTIWQFGLSALALLIVVTVTCLLSERLFNRLSETPSSLGDWSATITGLLLALTLPPGFPLWMGAVAGFIAIALGKALFGGLGMNAMNPALIGRAFVQAAFPVAITTWTPAFFEGRFSQFVPTTLTPPFLQPPALADWVETVKVDAFSGATPLALQKFEGVQTDILDMLLGTTAGSAGETSALLILICGLYLAARKMLDWRIPLMVMLGAAATAGIFFLIDPARYPDPLFVLCSGGLMLGAWFMASDMVGSPVTPLGVIIYGLMIGIITVIIRLFGGLTEGVMYAILLGNAATPLIDQITQPRVFGEQRTGK